MRVLGFDPQILQMFGLAIGICVFMVAWNWVGERTWRKRPPSHHAAE